MLDYRCAIPLFGFIPLVWWFFAAYPPRRAVMMAMIGGWLFLPVYGFKLKALPAIDKLTVPSYAVLMGAIMFDSQRLLAFRPKWVDLPMALFCCSSFFSSMSNNLGPYDGVSETIRNTIIWGLPYFIGRVYFNDAQGLRELAIGIFVGGLIYMPLCLLEMRISPQLHHFVYGFHPAQFYQARRFGGFRPTVFMQHGLAVSMYMLASSMLGLGLWRSGVLRSYWGIPMSYLVPAMLITTVLCKSVNAVALLALGLVLFASVKWLKTSLIVLLVGVLPFAYMYVRGSRMLTGPMILKNIGKYLGEDKEESLGIRLRNEDLLTQKALMRPAFGWGGWGRSRIKNNEGEDVTITDGLWIIVLGTQGILGVSMITLSIVLPGLLLPLRQPARLWFHPAVGAVASIAIILELHMLDNLMNGMVDPIFQIAQGGACALLAISPAARARTARPAIRGQVMPHYA